MASDGSDIHVLLRAGGGIPARGFDWDNVQFDPYRMGLYVDLKYGKALREGERNAGQVPVYGTNGRCGWHDASLSDGPGVILGRKGQGHLGVKWEPGPFWVIDTAYYAAVDPAEIDLKWLYYTCQYIGLDHLKSGEKPGLSRDVFRAQILPKPIRREQEAIARILGALDDKIELNRRMNRTLEALAQKLFKSWFVDFDPVLAKSQNRNPFGLCDEIAALFPDAFEDSELGPIPKGWRVAPLGDSFEIVMGQSPPGESYNEVGDGVEFFQGRTDFGFRFPTPRIYCKQPTRFAEAADTLVSVRAPVGDINVAENRCCIGRGLAAVRSRYNAPFFSYYRMKNLSEEFARFEGDGTLFGAIGGDAFRALKVASVPPKLIERFEEIGGSLEQRVWSNEKESRKLAALRDLLLPKLLSGEIRVPMADPEAESVFKEAVT